MREVINDIDRWLEEGHKIALATVVQVAGSAPRPTGAALAVTDDARMAGSVSGGCVEGAVVEEGRAVLRADKPRLLNYGIADEQGWSIGLSCGGIIDVYVRPLPEYYPQLRSRIERRQSVGLATRLDTGESLMVDEHKTQGTLGDPGLDRRAAEEIRGMFNADQAKRIALPVGDADADVFLQAWAPPPRLVIFGATHVAVALSALAQVLGYQIVVADAREVFANEERFPNIDQLIVGWPDEVVEQLEPDSATAVVILTHDPKFEDPLLPKVLQSKAGYIGAMGSRSTNRTRVEKLQAAGFGEDQIARIHAPIGLDIGGKSPEEMALAILAEMVAVRNGKRGGMLMTK